MKNVLVIRGADFSSHKVKKIDFVIDEIPCVGLSINESSHVATTFGNFTLAATPSPSNTTDEVIWESSNDNIATVANGIVSIVGVGKVDIIARCGNQVATCSVNAGAIEMNDLYFINELISATGSVGSGFIQRGTPTPKPNDFLGVTRVSDDTSIVPIVRYDSISENVRTIPIVMPYGATKIRITSTSAIPSTNFNYVYWCDSKTAFGDAKATLYVNANTIGNLSSIVGGVEYPMAEGADSCAIAFRTSSNIEDISTFIENYGLKFEFVG